MTDVFFYHLTSQPLERALPVLLEKCLERGWRVVVETPHEARVAALDDALWTYADDSFLPHGAGQGEGARTQPVWLTTTAENLNDAQVRALIDGAEPAGIEVYERVMILFDGNDGEAVNAARMQWKALKEQGHAVQYWKQSDGGRWEKAA